MPATFISVRGGHLMPAPPPPFQASPTFTNLVTLADSNDKAAWIFRAPKSGTTKTIGFKINTLTTAVDLRVAFQDVSTTNGDPDGVDDQSVVIASGSLAVGWNTSGTISRSVTKGDLLACVIIADSGTPSLTIHVPQYYSTGDAVDFPYADAFTTAWSKVARCACFALQYSDDSYEPIDGFVYPFSAFNAPSFNNGSSPDERGLRFQIPYTCKVDGAWFWGDIDGDTDVVLYDSDGSSVLTSVSLDKDTDFNASPGRYFVTFTTAVTLTAATYYRLVLKPTSATSISLQDFEVSTAALLDMCHLGQLAHYTDRVDAGAWTNTTTKRPWMGVRISDVQTDPGTATGGGALVNAGLAHAG